MKNKKLIITLVILLNCILIFGVVVLMKNKIGEASKKEKETKIEMTEKETISESFETESIVEENEELYIEDTEGFDIKTSYGMIQFPVAWTETVKTETVIEDKIETVQFWVTLEGKEEIHLFDIVFGGEGDLVGVIETDEGEEISVCVESYGY